jgi:hypothetical protein
LKLNIAFHNTYCFILGDLLLIHDFVHFLCWPKENEPKERAFLARIRWSFLPAARPLLQAEISSKASEIYAACKSYDQKWAILLAR